MSVHKDCGEMIRWFKRSDDLDRFLPPMDYVGQYYIATQSESGEDVAVMMAAYDIHRCDPDKMEAWQEYQMRLAFVKNRGEEMAEELQLPSNHWEIARERMREEQQELSLKYPCGACKALIDEPCYNMAIFKKTGEKQPVRYPHPKRIP